MIYWYYMYYQLNLAQKIIIIIAICSIIVAIIVAIKGIILMREINIRNKNNNPFTPIKKKKVKHK